MIHAISRLETVKLFLESKKGKKQKLSYEAKLLMLAIARESDKQGMDGIELSDEDLLELVRAETVQQAIFYTMKIMDFIGDTHCEQNAMQFIHHFCTMTQMPLENACEEIENLFRTLSIMQPKSRKSILNTIMQGKN